ncbi:MAG: hypothetical protein ACFFDF_22940, partial [Candidatus Odinarchaeota archaeon]
DRRVIQGHTSLEPITTLQNSLSPITDVIIILTSLLIWLGSGLILAYWVKGNMEKRKQEGKYVFFLILLTSFIGFIIYIIVSRGEETILENGETAVLEKDETLFEIEEIIKEEKKAEFQDEIEEISEEETEDIIESILEDTTSTKITPN